MSTNSGDPFADPPSDAASKTDLYLYLNAQAMSTDSEDPFADPPRDVAPTTIAKTVDAVYGYGEEGLLVIKLVNWIKDDDYFDYESRFLLRIPDRVTERFQNRLEIEEFTGKKYEDMISEAICLWTVEYTLGTLMSCEEEHWDQVTARQIQEWHDAREQRMQRASEREGDITLRSSACYPLTECPFTLKKPNHLSKLAEVSGRSVQGKSARWCKVKASLKEWKPGSGSRS